MQWHGFDNGGGTMQVVVAGAFDPAHTWARWCAMATEHDGTSDNEGMTEQCDGAWLTNLDVWNHSVKVPMPPGSGHVQLQVCGSDSDPSSCVSVAVNAPAVMWTAASDPSAVSTADADAHPR